MGSRRHLAVFTAATLVALGAARQAGATASDFYGNNFDENVLIPFAQCGPGGNDTLWAITNPGEPIFEGGFLHATIFDRDSNVVCDYDVPFTEGDVYPDSFCTAINRECGPNALAALLQPDGSRVGYIAIEGCSAPNCAQGTDVDTGDAFYGNIYYTDLGNNRATGLPAPTFDPTIPGGTYDALDLSDFPLDSDTHEISFRFLQGLNGDASAAQTRVVIWSDTSGNCNNGTIDVPDVNCLVGTGAANDVLICDEEEDCSSAGITLDREVEIFLADNIVPGGFATDGGYFNLSSLDNEDSDINGFQDGDLHLIGITDQEGQVAGTPAVRAAFYAPRD